MLIHLRDQLLALERIAALLKPGGTFISAEEYDPLPLPYARFRGNREKAVVFWIPTRRAWRSMLFYAGFDSVARARALHDARRAGLEDPPRRPSRHEGAVTH